MVYCHFMLVVLACVATLGCCADDKKKSPELTVTHEAWFVVEIQDHRDRGDDYVGTFVIGLFGREVPITVLNFVQLTRGYTSKEGMRSQKLGYKNTVFHKVVRDFTIQGGDVTVGDGTGGKSIFGESFDDESFDISHKAAGYVSMANHGKDTNASQFIILLNKARWLDGQHVVFGKIIKGMDVVQAIGEVDVVEETGKPKMKIKIVDCGVNELDTKYTLTEKEATSDEDIERDVEIY